MEKMNFCSASFRRHVQKVFILKKKIELAGFEPTTSRSASVRRNAQKAFVILKTLEFRSIQFSFSQSVFRQTAITLGNISRQKNR